MGVWNMGVWGQCIHTPIPPHDFKVLFLWKRTKALVRSRSFMAGAPAKNPADPAIPGGWMLRSTCLRA